MPRFLKPIRVTDIQPSPGAVYRALPMRVLLIRSVRRFSAPLVHASKAFVIVAAVWFFILGSASAPTTPTFAAATSTDSERQALESQLHDLESQINQYEGQISSYQKQGSTLKGQISQLNTKVSKLNLQIRAINLTLSDLDSKIVETQYQISATQASIDQNRGALGSLLKTLYRSDRENLVEVFLRSPKLSDFFSDVNNLSLVQNDVRVAIGKISSLHDDLQQEKEQFAAAKADASTLKDYQLAQKQQTDSLKQEKNQLLTETKGQESRYQDLLKKTKQTAAQIRNRIFELLGGGELTFDAAYQYAKLASDATGVRPALILAILDRESALGKNVGRCSYTTAMSPSNQQTYLSLTKALNLDPNSMYVSCPNADGVYGGAMGPAQFVPATWQLYTDQIAKATGHTPPSPWNNADAFMATALYLRDAGAVTASVTQERAAAARYYAGGNWRRYLWTYGEAVISSAQRFEQDIATITGT